MDVLSDQCMFLSVPSKELPWPAVRGWATTPPPLPHHRPGGCPQSPAISGGPPGPLAREVPCCLGDRVGQPRQSLLLWNIRRPFTSTGFLPSTAVGHLQCGDRPRPLQGTAPPSAPRISYQHGRRHAAGRSERDDHDHLSGVQPTRLVSRPFCQLPLPSVYVARARSPRERGSISLSVSDLSHCPG